VTLTTNDLRVPNVYPVWVLRVSIATGPTGVYIRNATCPCTAPCTSLSQPVGSRWRVVVVRCCLCCLVVAALTFVACGTRLCVRRAHTHTGVTRYTQDTHTHIAHTRVEQFHRHLYKHTREHGGEGGVVCKTHFGVCVECVCIKLICIRCLGHVCTTRTPVRRRDTKAIVTCKRRMHYCTRPCCTHGRVST
jgi:hypothetical protein